MKKIIQNPRTGHISVDVSAFPQCGKNGVLVKTYYSLISSGTEKNTVETAKKSLLGKAKKRPDLLGKIIDFSKKEGIKSAYNLIQSRLSTPLQLGYSCVGEVIEVGENEKNIMVGDIVACAGGGYATHAEVNFIPSNLVAKVPDGISYKDAAYSTLGAIALHGIRQSSASIGDSVCIVGMGLIGCLTAQLLKAQGCRLICVDVSEEALSSLDSFISANDLKINSSKDSGFKKIQSFTRGRGVDSVIITASSKDSSLINYSVEVLRDRGTLVILGDVKVDIPREPFYKKEINVKFSRSYGPGRYDQQYEEKGIDYPLGYVRWTENRNMECFLDMLKEKNINPSALTTHEFSIDEAVKGYEMILDKDVYCKGIVIDYNNPSSIKIEKTFSLNSVNAINQDIIIGFIGAGKFASSFLLPQLSKTKNVYFHTIVNNSGLSSKAIQKKYNFFKSSSETSDIVDCKEINLVFITSRHDTHCEYLIRALEKGKNIFIEKPICIKQNELEEIKSKVDQLSKANKMNVLRVGYNRRSSKISLKLKKELENHVRPISILYRVNAGLLDENHWLLDDDIGGGRIVGEVCHFVDYCIFLVGSKIKSVFSTSVNYNGSIKNQDSIQVNICFQNGSMATIIYLCDGDSSSSKEFIEVTGDETIYQIDDFKSLATIKSRKKRMIVSSSSQLKGYREEIEDLFAVLNEGESDREMPFDQIYHGMKVVFAIKESLRTNQLIKID